MDGGYFDVDSCEIDAFRDLTSQRLDPGAVPLAAAIDRNVPV